VSRREFSRAVKIEIVRRATWSDGNSALRDQYCEKCRTSTKGRFEIHHQREDALEVDKSKPLTAADGVLWCKPCHDEHTRKFSTPAVALAKRQEAAALGVEKPGKQKIAAKSKPAKITFKQDQIAALREEQFRRRFGG
jgi:hypothetical protein